MKQGLSISLEHSKTSSFLGLDVSFHVGLLAGNLEESKQLFWNAYGLIYLIASYVKPHVRTTFYNTYALRLWLSDAIIELKIFHRNMKLEVDLR